MRRAALALLLLASTTSAQDAARPGDWAAPFVVPTVPFVHASTTVGRRSVASSYSVRPDLSEAGPEVVYRVEVPAAGRLRATVEGDGGAVDVDVHLLRGLEVDAAGLAGACLARGNREAEASVPAGAYHVVVDTFEGAQRAGPYRLRIDVELDDAWYERPVAEGVRLRTKRYAALFGGVQTGSVLDVDLGAPGVVVKPLVAQGGCVVTSRLAERAGCVAAINGGFFDTSGGCRSVSLAKVDGELKATNARTRSALGIGLDGAPRIALVEAGRDWPEVDHALGGVGRLLQGGSVVVVPGAEGAGASFATARHPRTAAGITADGGLVLATLDGRSAAGLGVSLPDLAQWMAWLGCRDALNFDGGGSTTLWARGEGVVNSPSDGRERAVSTAVGVWARPLDRDAVWLVAPPADARVAAGAAWSCEVALADPEGARVAVRAEGAPGVAVQDRGDGTARVTWTGDGAASRTLRITGAVQGSRPVTRTVTLRP